jgi:dienelactone hydrolase
MRQIISTAVLVFAMVSSAMGAIKTQRIEYKQGDTVLEGYLAYDDATTARHPGVIVVHEWWGNNDYSHKRAEMLAQLGYAAFAIDMYGKGMVTTDAAKATEWSNAVKADMKNAVARAQLGLDTLKAQPMVDTTKISAIGYCFGGSIVLHMARNNFPLAGVVAFHGDLSPGPTPATQITPKVLVCHGADDTFVPQTAVTAFIEEMKKAKANYEIVEYANAVHAFTNPDAGKFNLQGVAYDKQADERSWKRMQDFFTEIFGTK